MSGEAIVVTSYGREIETADQIKAQVRRVQEVMKAIMKPNVHYGTIPGCAKPSLWKPGSEVLLRTFHIAVTPEVVDLSTADEIRVRAFVKGIHRETGAIVGTGIGECSSNEEKYKWRKAVCDQEWEDTPEDRRREKWGKGYKDKKTGKWTPPYKAKQVRVEIADVANTVLKMAKKRAQIDMTLTSTAASDIFTQDIEDMPAEMFDGNEGFVPDGEPIKVGDTAAVQVIDPPITNSERWRTLAARAKFHGKSTEDAKKAVAEVCGMKPISAWTNEDFAEIERKLTPVETAEPAEPTQ